MKGSLIYVHDPMCSWCWGFKTAWDTLASELSENINTRLLLGGLAPDSDEPMPVSMQQTLRQTWKHIEYVVPGTHFNHEFWTTNRPRRSTWPSCRAILAARAQNVAFEQPMITAIQRAYYQQALNPSDKDTLVSLAVSIGCDQQQFSDDLNSDEIRKQLNREIEQAMQLGIQGFPSLVFKSPTNHHHQIPIDYNNPQTMLEQIEQLNVA